jgi:uncharacterized paraquat-inducible protein A
MTKKWVYKLICSNKNCEHSEIDEFQWETCPRCGEKLVIVEKWPGGQ